MPARLNGITPIEEAIVLVIVVCKSARRRQKKVINEIEHEIE